MYAKVLVLLAVVIVAGGLVWYSSHMPSNMPPQVDKQLVPDKSASAEKTMPPANSQMQNEVSLRDASNASLEADVGAIDGGLKAAQSDSASVDQSLNDKPVQQSE